MTGLSGTGRVADDLYLIAHDEVSGKPLVSSRAAGLGLAGGLLAELVLAGAVGVAGDWLVVTGRPPRGEALAGAVLGVVAGERAGLPVSDWLAYLGRTAVRDVAGRLAGAGYLAAVRGWRGPRWVPTDPDCAFASLARLRSALSPSGPVSAGVVTAGLADACGLGPRMASYLPQGHYRGLGPAVDLLDPGLRALVAHVRAAVDSAVLCHRI